MKGRVGYGNKNDQSISCDDAHIGTKENAKEKTLKILGLWVSDEDEVKQCSMIFFCHYWLIL